MPLSRRSLLAATLGAAALPRPGWSKPATATFQGQTLVVASWQDYGADDPGTTKAFETMTGATVKPVYFTSEDGLLQMLREGGLGKIDVALPNLEYVLTAASEKLLQPIDTARIETWGSLQARFRDLSSIRLDGRVYAVPWTEGATSLAVNPARVKPQPTSWKALWDPANKGKVAFFDDPTTAVMTAALYLGENPANPDLAKVRAALLDLKRNVKLFWSSADDWDKAYITGAITMGNLWSGLAGALNTAGHKVDFIMPADGTVVWGDTWAIARNAPHLDLAYAWISYLTSTPYFVEWITHPGPSQELAVPVNLAAVKALPKRAAESLEAYKIIGYRGPVALQTGIGAKKLKAWTELWEEVKAA